MIGKNRFMGKFYCLSQPQPEPVEIENRIIPKAGQSLCYQKKVLSVLVNTVKYFVVLWNC